MQIPLFLQHDLDERVEVVLAFAHDASESLAAGFATFHIAEDAFFKGAEEAFLNDLL